MIPEPMQRALALARNAPEPTSPNPAVGAVIAGADGRIAGEGVTEPPPGAHGEIVALRHAGPAAKGGTLYVTLEPCNHHGRTPPCTEAIIAAGIAEVHFAVADPNPNSSGGQAVLQAASVRIVVGEGEAEARRINEAFFKYRTTGLPFVIAKFAASLDGKIAAASGDSRWVSGPETRAWAHQLRTKIDAILVGSSTVVIDDPLLTARPDGVDAKRQPLRVVVDTRGRTPPMAQVFTGPAKTLVATSAAAPPEWRAAIEARGAAVLPVSTVGEHVDLRALLVELGKRDVVTLLVEGGGVILGGFFDAGLVDKVHAIIAPMIIGAADALRLSDVTVERLGEDVLVTGYVLDPPDNKSRAQE